MIGRNKSKREREIVGEEEYKPIDWGSSGVWTNLPLAGH